MVHLIYELQLQRNNSIRIRFCRLDDQLQTALPLSSEHGHPFSNFWSLNHAGIWQNCSRLGKSRSRKLQKLWAGYVRGWRLHFQIFSLQIDFPRLYSNSLWKITKEKRLPSSANTKARLRLATFHESRLTFDKVSKLPPRLASNWIWIVTESKKLFNDWKLLLTCFSPDFLHHWFFRCSRRGLM